MKSKRDTTTLPCLSHTKAEWHLKSNKWREPKRVKLYGFGAKTDKMSEEREMQMRRTRFMDVWKSFFIRCRESHDFATTFTPDEEAHLLKQYFHKYFDGRLHPQAHHTNKIINKKIPEKSTNLELNDLVDERIKKVAQKS